MFEELDWKPIRNCPGRFILRDGGSSLSPADILGGEESSMSEHRVQAASDTVLVLRLEGGGGLISYRRANGSHLYTLNTREGFERKLAQLGIEYTGS